MYFSLHVLGNGGQLHKSAHFIYTFSSIGEDYQTEPVRVNTASTAPFSSKIDLAKCETRQNYCIFALVLARSYSNKPLLNHRWRVPRKKTLRKSLRFLCEDVQWKNHSKFQFLILLKKPHSYVANQGCDIFLLVFI